MGDLEIAVQNVIGRCLGVREGENVVVIADPGTQAIGDALRAAAARVGADAILTIMDERANDGTDPPPTVAAAMRAADVYIAPTSRSLSHTPARKAASEAGVRGATLPGVNEEMLARVMAVDFGLMAARSRAVADLLSSADEAHVTCPLGTDLSVDLRGREGIPDDGNLSAPGAFGNLPAGEAFAAPRAGSGVVYASSLAPFGRSDEPALLTIADGCLTAAEHGSGPEFLARLRSVDERATNLAELGIGTNDCARLTGNILEDEKILGTVHVAFGASAGIGGEVSVPIHLDVVILDASLTIGTTRVLEAGRFVLTD